MGTSRLEAFSDGVLAIVLTIMVLELRAGEGADLAALRPVVPVFLGYALSFVYIGIYWNNHHHLFHAAGHVGGRVLWANLHLLFWLSLVPFVTGWMGEHASSAWPVAVYGAVLLMAGLAYRLLVVALLRVEGPDSALARAIGSDRKGIASVALYALGIGASFVDTRAALAIYVLVALIWLVPDRRIEKALELGM